MSYPTTCFLSCANHTSEGEVVLLSKARGEVVHLGRSAPVLFTFPHLYLLPKIPSPKSLCFTLNLPLFALVAAIEQMAGGRQEHHAKGQHRDKHGRFYRIADMVKLGPSPSSMAGKVKLGPPPSSTADKVKLDPPPPQPSARSSLIHPPPLAAGSLRHPPPGAPSWWR
jgi:hypothetical protein